MNEDYPINRQFRLLFETDQIQNFLQRHNLVREFSSIKYSLSYMLGKLWGNTFA